MVQDSRFPKFVADRNQLMAILNQESSLMEIVKLIGSDVLPDDQKLTLEIARVIRLGFLQQNAFHQEDTCVPMEKQFQMMETILYLYEKSKALINRGMPVSVLKRTIFLNVSFRSNTMFRTISWTNLNNTDRTSTHSTTKY